MCGIFGLVSRTNFGFNGTSADLLENMAHCGQLRGTHGTGFFSSDKEAKQDWVKIGGATDKLLATKEYTAFINKVIKDSLCVVGHNRFATRGDHSTNNAHPFKHKHIMLVHNGLVSSTDLEKNKVKVDSHSFTKDLANAGDDWKDLLKDTKGAFCFVWHDSKENKLFIYRNNERPMAMYESDANYMFASERGMVHWLGARRNLRMDNIEIKPEVLYSFDMSTKYSGPFRKMEEESLPLNKSYVTYTTGSYDHYGHSAAANGSWEGRTGWKNGIYTPPAAITHTNRGAVTKKFIHNKKVGDTVLFSLYDESAQGLAGSPNEWKYTGLLEEDNFSQNIDVLFLTKNRSAEWLDYPLLTGVICNIHPDGSIQVKTRSVKEVEATTIITQKQADLTLDEDEVITLKDGERMSRFKFRKLTAMKCHGCNSKITDEEYPGCSYSARISCLFCPDCTITIEHDQTITHAAMH